MSNNNWRARERLLKDFPADKFGTWEIRAEDHNADLGGHHHQQLLGYYEGEYAEIVEFAVEIPGFFAWGAGGNIREVKVQKIDEDSAWQLKKAKADLARIEKEKLEIEKRVTFYTLGAVK